MKKKLHVNLLFWGDDEHKLYHQAQLHALKQRQSATDYIKQAIAEKNKKEDANNNKGD